VLQGKGIRPHRALDDDLKLTDQAMSYDGSAARRSTVSARNNPPGAASSEMRNPKSEIRNGEGWPKLSNGKPDFANMTSAQRFEYDAQRLRRRFE
jgi:hypothetical protein